MTAAEMLRGVVDMLRSSDRAFEMLGEILHETPPKTTAGQADLLMMAAWLDDHPDIDAQMTTVVTAGDDPPSDGG